MAAINSTIQQQASAFINTYNVGSDHAPILPIAVAFFQNGNNVAAVEQMVNDIGLPVAYNGYSAWALYLYYFYAYYCSRYPVTSSTSCNVLAGYIAAMDDETANLDKRHIPGGDLTDDGNYAQATQALQQFKTNINSAYAQANCDNVLTQQDTQQLTDTIQSAGQTATNTGSSNIGIYVVYGFAILTVALGAYLLFHKKKSA
jgi:hypothetical protein